MIRFELLKMCRELISGPIHTVSGTVPCEGGQHKTPLIKTFMSLFYQHSDSVSIGPKFLEYLDF